MNVVDIIIIVLLLLYVAKGFSNGVFKEGVTFVGGLFVVVLAFLFKNPISQFMYESFPFFKFSGMANGISVLNIIIYEIIAFLVLATVLLVLYDLILKLTNVLEKVLRWTFVFALPSKILGAVVGFVEGVVIVFFLLFICIQFEMTRPYINESKYGDAILSQTPVLAPAIEPTYKSLKEIHAILDKYKDSEDRDAANLESLEILLKYKVLTTESARTLVSNGKLTMAGVEELIDRYNS